ncbi:tRNA-dihydrouridine(20a/20b) synthase [NAD(P)+] [Lachnellula hyalina]|uniref:tRNA-dihydrouridine synthase n=1 Tax=Lachnellula hyalina TaxID=1316788 RepID=A0A8H8R193_9HELO|nr:tRNA-dihydrouridine(20a/20b) synthase [NAD(P)+] [Lachnellula hyalina]TVY25054.1 tRNA-dihydrouridine(20a/20b) synthase [NAD(P)+] [Lachnellula hyalina]
MPNITEGDGEALQLPSSLDINPLQLFDIAKSEGRPLYTSAPMVRYSKLAFRETVARYGTDLTWTPMILAKEFNRSLFARDSAAAGIAFLSLASLISAADFTTSPTAPPTIVQFGCNSPDEISRATTLLAPYVNGIDINCGCPQSWACAETLGAALMHKRELVASMVTAAKNTLASLGYSDKKTVSVKIRIHKDLRQTSDFIRTVEAAGVDFITIHGRTRSTPSHQPVDLNAIALLTAHTTVPTLSNGDVFSLADAHEHVEATGVDGVMSARGILENPALFFSTAHSASTSTYEGCSWGVVETFVNNAIRAPIPFKLIVHHLSQMCGSDHSQSGKTLLTKEQRGRLMACKGLGEVIDLLDEVREMEGGLRRY